MPLFICRRHADQSGFTRWSQIWLASYLCVLYVDKPLFSISSATFTVMGRHPQLLACSRCHWNLCSKEALTGILCSLCHSLFSFASLIGHLGRVVCLNTWGQSSANLPFCHRLEYFLHALQNICNDLDDFCGCSRIDCNVANNQKGLAHILHITNGLPTRGFVDLE